VHSAGGMCYQQGFSQQHTSAACQGSIPQQRKHYLAQHLSPNVHMHCLKPVLASCRWIKPKSWACLAKMSPYVS
jgi:hypothetical protein